MGKMRSYDWSKPLPFGDNEWVKKSDVEPLVDAVTYLLRNIYEFDRPTDEVFIEMVEKALLNLTGKPPVVDDPDLNWPDRDTLGVFDEPAP